MSDHDMCIRYRGTGGRLGVLMSQAVAADIQEQMEHKSGSLATKLAHAYLSGRKILADGDLDDGLNKHYFPNAPDYTPKLHIAVLSQADKDLMANILKQPDELVLHIFKYHLRGKYLVMRVHEAADAYSFDRFAASVVGSSVRLCGLFKTALFEVTRIRVMCDMSVADLLEQRHVTAAEFHGIQHARYARHLLLDAIGCITATMEEKIALVQTIVNRYDHVESIALTDSWWGLPLLPFRIYVGDTGYSRPLRMVRDITYTGIKDALERDTGVI